MFGKDKLNKWKFGFAALFIGFLAGYLTSIYLGTTSTGMIPAVQVNPENCFKYNGELPDAYCDSGGSLHFYFKGNDELKEGWYLTENSEECRKCSFVSFKNE